MRARLSGLPIVLALVAMTACATSFQAKIIEASAAADGRTLRLAVDTCNADLMARTEESPSQVTVTVTARHDTNDDCQDVLVVNLERPLGTRQLVDGAAGEAVAVGR